MILMGAIASLIIIGSSSTKVSITTSASDDAQVKTHISTEINGKKTEIFDNKPGTYVFKDTVQHSISPTATPSTTLVRVSSNNSSIDVILKHITGLIQSLLAGFKNT